MSENTPQELAENCAKAMFSRDRASQKLGMKIESIAPGRAVLSMAVTEDMIQGHGSCHGGYLFTLADSAFAFACNSYNKVTVAQSNSITYVAPARTGDRLTAMAVEIARSGRSGTWDVTVTNQDGATIALFRGLARTISGTLFEEE